MAGTEIARIADLNNMEVLVEVNESDIIRVARNDTALIEVDAYLNRDFKGIITEIASSAQLQGVSADQVTNFEVKVRILKSSYEDLTSADEKTPFRPGMTATVEIITERKKDVIGVPIEAVTTRSDTSSEAKSYRTNRDDRDKEYEVVFLFKNGKADLQVVKTGIQDDEYIEITKGLSQGQPVITGPYSVVSKQLVNGDYVQSGSEKKLSTNDQGKD
ncbi:MAG: HlyD family efflux transporter periplasmic adaptor subunit [Owenweeksia sp.]|nr:HlyD family efflux transporter periplasmic adaptor subunit [Owenweeksia sp.]